MDGERSLIALDTNILLYAHRKEFPQHGPALRALKALAEGHRSWALPVFVVSEFLRVATHPRILDPPTDEATAVAVIHNVLESPTVRVLSPETHYWEILSALVIEERLRGNLVYDAQIAAVCIEHGADTILTEDRDFSRFDAVTVLRLDKA